MKTLLKVSLFVLLVIHWPGFEGAEAHPGHEHVLTKDEAIARAAAVVVSLVKKKKKVAGEILDDSWINTAQSATCKGTPEFYLMAVNNPPAGKTLYLLLTTTGKYLRANFDGLFAELTFSSYPVYAC